MNWPWKRFFRSKRGNVAIITALAAIPMCFLVGMGIDYGTAADRQVQLDAYADAAALAAVTPGMMAQSVAQATTAAQNTFNAQAAQLTSITYSPTNLSVAITTSGSKRSVTVTYAATYNTFFATLLGRGTMPISGSSTATGGLPPNINFYLLLDDSPSMAIAATSAGITTMINNTQGQCDNPPYGGTSCGCAFGCHESNPSGESHYIQTGTGSPLCTASNNYKYCSLSGLGNPSGEDNYALARALGVTLRIDLLSTATANLMTTAQSTESGTNATYQMAIYTFDTAFNKIQTLTSNLSIAASSAASISLLEVYQNNMLTSSNSNNDEDTNYETAMSSINSLMPNPGSGTNTRGDVAQEVLFLVTDGVEDECETPTLNSYSGGGCRQQYLMNSNTDWCSTVKNRGIRIAVLYTEYLPIPNNGWYENFDGGGAGISFFQSQIGTQLQNCASPGLYFEVDSGGDISSALAELFNSAVQSAYLAK